MCSKLINTLTTNRMNNIFILSSCSFTKLGLESLFIFDNEKENIRFHAVNNCRDIISYLRGSQNTMEHNFIIMDIPTYPRELRVRQTINMWSICYLKECYPELRDAFVLLLGIYTGTEKLPIIEIPPNSSPETLSFMISEMMKSPQNYTKLGDGITERLCNHQKMILSKLTHGYSAREIAELMERHPVDIFRARKQLINKLGLHNKYDFYYIGLSMEL